MPFSNWVSSRLSVVETIQIDYSCVFVNLAIEYSLLSDAVDFFSSP
jgi:hypothetical protein